MAHELDMTNGRANMAFVGEQAWHGLGSRLTEDAPIETWAVEAGMNWNVKKSALVYRDENKIVHRFPDRQALYRSDNSAALGVVGNNYRVVQPGEVLEFFRDLIDGHDFKLETAGCLFGGRKFWALARTGKDTKIMGQDVVSPYLLMATSCDGSMSTAVHMTSVRVVCNNTLRMSIGDKANKAQIRVPHSAEFNAQYVKSQLGIVGDAWENFLMNVEQLAKFKLGRDEAIQIVADELKDEWKNEEGDDMKEEEMLESSIILRRIISLYDGEGLGADYTSSQNTAWGLVNAVTQFFDHEAGSKSADKSRTFERAHLTDRATLKVKIANKLLQHA